MTTRSQALRFLTLSLGLVVTVELVLLRTGTRTLVHIPGLGRFEVATGFVAEVGRLAFYTATLTLVLVLVVLGRQCWVGGFRGRMAAGLIWLFLLVAMGGRIGVLPNSVVGWFLVVCLTVATLATWRGVPSIPLGLFVAASIAASWSVLGQGIGGGLSGQTIDLLVLTSEVLLILAGLTAPLVVAGGITRGSLFAGSAVLLATVAGFSLGGSTLSILTLWNLGVPGWLSPLAFGFALSGLVVAVWSSAANHEWFITVALVLLIGGGIGTISTYQTALVFTGILLAGWDALVPPGDSQVAGDGRDLHRPRPTPEVRSDRSVVGGVAN